MHCRAVLAQCCRAVVRVELKDRFLVAANWHESSVFVSEVDSALRCIVICEIYNYSVTFVSYYILTRRTVLWLPGAFNHGTTLYVIVIC